MATITSATDGLWNDGATWVGGVAPVLGDKVNIGHTVTVEGVCAGGDDTSTAININSGGTLKASRTADSQLTVRGELVRKTGGIIDYGKSSDPIPAAYTARLITNNSASMGDGKWGMTSENNSECWIYGAYKKTNTRIVTGISAGATSVRVEDATGWAIGDKICLGPTGTSSAENDYVTITNLTLVSGTVYDVYWSGGCSFAHAANGYVANCTRNVIVGSSDERYGSYWFEFYNTTQAENTCEIRNCVFINGTQVGGNFHKLAGFCISPNANTTQRPWISFGDVVFLKEGAYNSNGTAFVSGNHKGLFVMDNVAVVMRNNAGGTTNGILSYQGGVINYDSVVFYRTSNNSMHFSYSEGSRVPQITNSVFTGSAGQAITIGGGVLPVLDNCHFWSNNRAIIFNVANSPLIKNSFFGQGGETPDGARDTQAYLVSPFISGVGELTLRNCMINSYQSDVINKELWTTIIDGSRVVVEDKNGDVTAQEYHYRSGSFFRDNSTVSRGTSSIRLDTLSAAATSFPDIPILAPNGVQVTIKGRLRKNAAYGSSTRPSVTLSGLGITPVTFTMTDSVDTWEEFTLQSTQVSGADGNLYLTFTGQSENSAGQCWLDGVPFPPFVTSVDHYGYLYQPTDIKRTVDNVITESNEATVAAYTGISIADGVITITEDHSITEIYDYCQYYRVENHVAPFFESADGVNFTCTYDLTLDGGNITGIGAISMSGNTFARTGAEFSTVIITHNAGTFTRISVNGIVAGSRLRLWNATDNIELVNQVISGTSHIINFEYTTDKSIELSLTNVSGVTAYLPFLTANTISAGGLSFLAAQELDTVYNGNAIDGSTVTEFSADYPNIKININDPDYATSVQRLYAWFKHAENTENGIRYFVGGLVADDEVNYKIVTNIADLHLDNTEATPVVISGARIYRDDGETVIVATSGSIQMDPDKAYIADGSFIAGAVWDETDAHTTPGTMGARLNHADNVIGDEIE